MYSILNTTSLNLVNFDIRKLIDSITSAYLASESKNSTIIVKNEIRDSVFLILVWIIKYLPVRRSILSRKVQLENMSQILQLDIFHQGNTHMDRSLCWSTGRLQLLAGKIRYRIICRIQLVALAEFVELRLQL